MVYSRITTRPSQNASWHGVGMRRIVQVRGRFRVRPDGKCRGPLPTRVTGCRSSQDPTSTAYLQSPLKIPSTAPLYVAGLPLIVRLPQDTECAFAGGFRPHYKLRTEKSRLCVLRVSVWQVRRGYPWFPVCYISLFYGVTSS